jgi:hypothetical protein
VNVIDVAHEIFIVSDLMLPTAALPERQFPVFAFGGIKPIGV